MSAIGISPEPKNERSTEEQGQYMEEYGQLAGWYYQSAADDEWPWEKKKRHERSAKVNHLPVVEEEREHPQPLAPPPTRTSSVKDVEGQSQGGPEEGLSWSLDVQPFPEFVLPPLATYPGAMDRRWGVSENEEKRWEEVMAEKRRQGNEEKDMERREREHQSRLGQDRQGGDRPGIRRSSISSTPATKSSESITGNISTGRTSGISSIANPGRPAETAGARSSRSSMSSRPSYFIEELDLDVTWNPFGDIVDGIRGLRVEEENGKGKSKGSDKKPKAITTSLPSRRERSHGSIEKEAGVGRQGRGGVAKMVSGRKISAATAGLMRGSVESGFRGIKDAGERIKNWVQTLNWGVRVCWRWPGEQGRRKEVMTTLCRV